MTVEKSTPPLVSIIMPAYNAARYIRESIDSVLRQDFSDFELIIVNDGSTDGTKSIIDQYSKIDNRIRPIHQKNIGLVATLNKAISQSLGLYIARIDGDDPWMDAKLSQQMDILINNPEVVLIGGGFEIIDQDGYFIETIHTPTRDEDIRRTMLLRNPFGHAGVVFSKDAFVTAGGYIDSHGPTEDFELWIRLSEVGRVTNLQRPIYRYRIVEDGISQSNSSEQMRHTKTHIESLWVKSTPRTLSRSEIKKQADRYLHANTRAAYAIGLKEQFLLDNAQIGIKLLRHGHIRKGVAQLFSVASVGRSGIRAVVKRLRVLDRGSVRQLLD